MAVLVYLMNDSFDYFIIYINSRPPRLTRLTHSFPTRRSSDLLQSFTAPNTDPPTKQQHTVSFSGDLGDAGDIYKVVVDGVLFSYVTTGVEGSRSEEHTSELQSLMRNSYAVFCLKKKRRL